MCGLDRMVALAARAASGAGLLVMEGVMGLFDGAADGRPSSTADVARVLMAPILLVIDASAMASSAAALLYGFAKYDPSILVSGVVFNRVGSDGHETMLKEAVESLGIPVLGALRRDDRFSWRDRHLGLIPVAEDPEAVNASLDLLASAIESYVDLDEVERIARSAEPMKADPVDLPRSVGPARVAVASGPAFSFTYTDTIEALDAAGVEIVTFDPLVDETLPEHLGSGGDLAGLDGLLIGGGFPEVYAQTLSENQRLLDDIARQVKDGLVTWAECGGLLLLCESLDGHRLAGVIPAQAEMAGKLVLGYREVATTVASPLGPVGTNLRGHEFHYSRVDPTGSALEIHSRFGHGHDGFATPDMLATYVHFHPGGDSTPISNFATRAALRRASRRAEAG
jgi:cobyrinic acid a,c-diamide synthase